MPASSHGPSVGSTQGGIDIGRNCKVLTACECRSCPRVVRCTEPQVNHLDGVFGTHRPPAAAPRPHAHCVAGRYSVYPVVSEVVVSVTASSMNL